MNVQEVARKFSQDLLAGNHKEAGEGLQLLMSEPDGATQVAYMLSVLLTGMQRGALRRALEWVLKLPGASTVLLDVRKALTRVEAGKDLEQGD